MPHQQDYDILRNSLSQLSMPMECIDHILEYSNVKNLYSIYQQCLREVVDIVNNSVFLYHLERVDNIEAVIPEFTSSSFKQMIFRRKQFNTEYLKRCERNDDTEDLDALELIFYLVLEEKHPTTIHTMNVMDIRYTCTPQHVIKRRNRNM